MLRLSTGDELNNLPMPTVEVEVYHEWWVYDTFPPLSLMTFCHGGKMPASRDGDDDDDDDDDMMTGHFGDEVARWPTRGMDRLQLVARTQVAYLLVDDDHHDYHDHAFVGPSYAIQS